MSNNSSSPSGRQVSARALLAITHFLVVGIDGSMVGGEFALRILGMVVGIFIPKVLDKSIEGLVTFIFIGNPWWVIGHLVALPSVAFFPRFGWYLTALLIVSRVAVIVLNGGPYMGFIGEACPTGFNLFFLGILAVLAFGLALHGVPGRRNKWEELAD